MAQARDVGERTAEALRIEHLNYHNELPSFSTKQFLPSPSLIELVGEPPASELERLNHGARWNSGTVTQRGTGQRARHTARVEVAEGCVVARIVRIVEETPGRPGGSHSRRT